MGIKGSIWILKWQWASFICFNGSLGSFMKPLIPITIHTNLICIHFMSSFFIYANVSCTFVHAFELFILETKIKCVKMYLLQPDGRIVINILFTYDINLTKELNCTFSTCFNLFTIHVLTFEMRIISDIKTPCTCSAHHTHI